MPYNSIISRSEAAALIPEEAAREIISALPEASTVMSVSRRLPDMNRGQLRLPVSSALVSGYWVSPTDTGVKQTGEANWTNVYVNAEELAVIVPIAEAVLDDADFDIWAQIRPQIVEAFGKAFDEAVFYGTNAPASFPDDILTDATSASHVLSLASFTDAHDAILGDGGLFSLVEQDGFMVNGSVAALSMKGKLRGLRDTFGQPVFMQSMQGASQYTLDGEPIFFPRNGAVNPASSLLIAGDWNQLVYAMRQDITYKILDQAVITDGSGVIQYNLAQQDMVALRAVMRIGWALPNPINRVNSNAATRYPFAVLTA